MERIKRIKLPYAVMMSRWINEGETKFATYYGDNETVELLSKEIWAMPGGVPLMVNRFETQDEAMNCAIKLAQKQKNPFVDIGRAEIALRNIQNEREYRNVPN